MLLWSLERKIRCTRTIKSEFQETVEFIRILMELAVIKGYRLLLMDNFLCKEMNGEELDLTRDHYLWRATFLDCVYKEMSFTNMYLN